MVTLSWLAPQIIYIAVFHDGRLLVHQEKWSTYYSKDWLQQHYHQQRYQWFWAEFAWQWPIRSLWTYFSSPRYCMIGTRRFFVTNCCILPNWRCILQELYGWAPTSALFERLCHAGPLELYETSFSKLFDLMVMGFKHQIMSTLCSSHLLGVTINHVSAGRRALNARPVSEWTCFEYYFTMGYRISEPVSMSDGLCLKYTLHDENHLP